MASAEERISDFDFRVSGTPEEEDKRRKELDDEIDRLAAEAEDDEER
jgi:hypothetical protein